MTTEDAFRGWQALRAACFAVHDAEMKGRIGGAVICVCGHGCGGCAACSMLGMIKSFVVYCDTERMSKVDREWIETMRSVV